MKAEIKENAIITIRSTQTDEDGDNTVEFVTNGFYGSGADGWLVEYRESEMTGLGDTTTAIEVKGDLVALKRRGAVTNDMNFRLGVKDHSFYAVDIPDDERDIVVSNGVDIVVTTVGIDDRLTVTGGTLSVVYTIEIDHAFAATNKFDITVKMAGKQ